MTEVDFAKGFLVALSSRPVRIPADYVEDPRKLPARPPTTLSKLPQTMKKRQKREATDSPHANITLKTLRPPHTINESHSLPLNTTFAFVKQKLSTDTSVPFDKLRFLHKGKIVADSKTVGDLTDEGRDQDVTVNVMLMGGAVVVRKAEAKEEEEGKDKDVEMKEPEPEAEPKTEGGDGGGDAIVGKADETLGKEEFWGELKMFLEGKLGTDADGVLGCFRSAWESKQAAP